MISRRGFFGMLAGLATSPLFGLESLYAGPIPGYDYQFHYKNFICDDLVSSGNIKYYKRNPELEKHMNTIMVWRTPPGTLYWSKENS